MHERLVKSGAVVSTAGVVLFISFVLVLLVFPVVKSCEIEDAANCTFASTAPRPFDAIVQPGYLALSLLTIAAGVFMVRFGRWRDSKQAPPAG